MNARDLDGVRYLLGRSREESRKVTGVCTKTCGKFRGVKESAYESAVSTVVATGDDDRHAGDTVGGCLEDVETVLNEEKDERGDFRVTGTPLETWKTKKTESRAQSGSGTRSGGVDGINFSIDSHKTKPD